MNIRKMNVSGSFYPSSENEILSMIDHFNSILESHSDALKEIDSLRGNAIIVPHAGWVYSGFTANIAFKTLARSIFKRIVVIGPSHRVGFEGISICDMDVYETPLGTLQIDKDLVKDLMNRFPLSYYPQAHHEHSTEVQFPFIKHYFPHSKVVEMVYAYSDPSSLKPIIEYLLKLKTVAVVISTDLSHYYSLNEANKLDSICLESIRSENTALLHQGCEACGLIGVEALIDVARSMDLESHILDYRTSADAFGDTSRVVGYTSALFSGGT